jgi:DNA-binding MarR family transcriptional regulator
MNLGIDDSLRRAAAAYRVAMERALAPLDVTPAQFSVLEILANKSGLSGAEISRLERLTPPTMSVIIANLERMGALARGARADNARIQRLDATERGLALTLAGREAVAALRERIAGTIPAGGAPAILAWLRQVARIEV